MGKSKLPLTKASRDPTETDLVVVGTANRNAKKHLVVILDTSMILSSENHDPDTVVLGMALVRNVIVADHGRCRD